MANKIFNFSVDTHKKNSLCMAHVKQLDTAIFNITITTNGKEKDLTGQSLRLFIRKADGKLVVQEDIEIINAVAGKIRINVKNSAFQCVGTAVAEIDMIGADGEASTGNFLFDVDEKLGNNEAVESIIDVNLFEQLTRYINTALAEISKYKELFESFVEAGVSLEGLNDIKAYIDNNLAELKFETDEAVDLIPKVNKARTDAEAKRVEVVDATNTAEAKRVQVVNATNSAESKRVEVVNATNTANTSKTNLETATANADAKKKELETATANAESKRVEVVSVTNTADASKKALETATASANSKKAEVETATANAEEVRVEVVSATNTANTTKTALDGSIASGNTLKSGLDASITSGNSTKSALETATSTANTKKSELVTATNNAESKRAEVVTATNNANTKKGELVTATNNAESKRAELQAVIDSVESADIVTSGQLQTALDGKSDSNHNHDSVYSKTTHNHDTAYAPKSHTHDYSPSSHNHDSVYSKTTHNHDSVYAKASHTHNYASSTHSHGEYLTKGLWSTNGGQDLLVHGKRALVGTTAGELHLGYGGDFSKILCGNFYEVYHTGRKPSASEVGAVPSGNAPRISNANSITSTGIYAFSSGSSNVPCTYGVIFHAQWNTTTCAQFCMNVTGPGTLYFRTNNNGWSGWRAV